MRAVRELSVRAACGGVLGRAQRTGGAKRKATAAVRVKPKPVCNFFLRGVCKAGNACEYQHAGVPRTKSQLCKFWRSSPAECQKGDACPYAHDFSVEPCKVRPRSLPSHLPTCPNGGAAREVSATGKWLNITGEYLGTVLLLVTEFDF